MAERPRPPPCSLFYACGVSRRFWLLLRADARSTEQGDAREIWEPREI
ncbi:MAG: hypothetical protein IJS15_02810 [Victivallales bacterium]|nr:hypothetical protein [Victivallales bacterium]